METQNTPLAPKYARLAALIGAIALAGCASPPYAGRPAEPPARGAPTPTSTQDVPKANPASTALLQESRSLHASGQYDAAAASLERALGIDPRNPALWVELGRLQLSLGDSRQAENMARKAISLSGNADAARAPAWTLLAQALRAQGRDSEAREAEINAR